MNKPLAWLAVISVFFACAFCSSGKPDFTGTWVQVGGSPMPGTTPDPDLEARLKMKQDGADQVDDVGNSFLEIQTVYQIESGIFHV